MTFRTDNTYDDDSDSGGGFQLPGEGRYLLQWTRAFLTESKKGHPMIAGRLHIVGDEQWATQYVREWIVLVDTSYGYGKLGNHCRAGGVRSFSEDPTNGLDPHSQESLNSVLVSMVIAADIKHKHVNDKVYLEISRVNAPTAKERSQLAADGWPAVPNDAFEDWHGNPTGANAGKSWDGDDEIPF